MEAVRIIIADDHPLMRAALKEAISAQLGTAEIVEASSVAQLADLLGSRTPVDVVLLDLRMPDARGFAALVGVRAQFPSVPVIVISATEDAGTVDRAMLLGASGYILKSSPIDTVGDTIRTVLGGGIARPAQSAQPDRDDDVAQFRKLRALTPQQVNVLVMIAEGLSNKVAAQRLGITESTVKAHITSILLKLGLQRRTQAALLAQRAMHLHGIVGEDEFQE
jgi:DNA-binding NarL/FixJ family response regulator